jgi:CubicO group peptidase (beta-lactamase class C family)
MSENDRPFKAAIAQFAEQISRDIEEDNAGSITAAVVMGNEQIWAKGFGWADTQKKIPADAQTIYRTGSISKSFTAVLLVQLQEQGVLELDDRVEQYFPEIKQLAGYSEYQPITFKQLASHTSGLIREPELPDAASGPIEEWEAKVLASIPTTSFQSAPGECFSYSNIGYGILGLAISRAVKRPFMELVGDLIFDPLRMKSSGFVLTPEMGSHLAVGYVRGEDGIWDAEFPAKEHAGRGYKVPNGGIYSTVGDLGRFIAAQTGSAPIHILSAESRAEMQKRQIPGKEEPGYGLGFCVWLEEDGNCIIGHEGMVAGYHAYLIFDPESRIGVVLLRNYSEGKTDLVQCANRLLRELVTVDKKADDLKQ